MSNIDKIMALIKEEANRQNPDLILGLYNVEREIQVRISDEILLILKKIVNDEV